MIKKTVMICAMLSAVAVCAEIIVKSGNKIAFLGDSITQYGNNYPGGYVNLVIAGLEANGIKAEKVPAGISGNKSNQMLERLERDVISKNPQFMTLSCGVNDVWHGKRGIPLPEYKKNITALVEKAQAAGIKVCILTATMITENPASNYNKQLAGYNDFLRKLAAEKNCLLVDLNDIMQKGIAQFKEKHPGFKGNLYTNDGVHMNAFGDSMMAENILRGFGLNDAQIAKARTAWKGKKVSVGRVTLSAESIEKAAVKAAEKNLSIQGYIESLLE